MSCVYNISYFKQFHCVYAFIYLLFITVDVQLDVMPQCPQEEQEQLWSSWEGEQLNSFVPGKSEDVKEETQSLLIHQRRIDGDRESPVHCSTVVVKVEDLKGSEPVCNSAPESFVQTINNTVNICDQADKSDVEWNVSREPEAKLKLLKNTGVSESEHECNAGVERVVCSKCGRTSNDVVQSYMQNPLGELVCSVCLQEPRQSSHIVRQKKKDSETKTFISAVYKKLFNTKSATTTGQKLLTCSLCNTRLSAKTSLTKHMRIHTGEKPFSCTVCSKRFRQKTHLKQHTSVHTGERSFSCHVCGKRYSRPSGLKIHKCVPQSSCRPDFSL